MRWLKRYFPQGWIPTVRVKLLLFLCAVSLLPLLLSTRTLMVLGGRSTRTLRELQVKDGLERTMGALQAVQDHLAYSARIVAEWQELPQAVNPFDSVWVKKNLESWVPQSYNLDYLAICSNSGKTQYQWTSAAPPDSFEVNPHVLLSDTLTSGLISTPRELYFLAQSRINDAGGRVGWLIFGQRIHHRLLMNLKANGDQDISVYYGGKLLATTDTTSTLPYIDPGEIFSNLITRQGTYLFYTPEDERIVGFQTLKNLQDLDVAAVGWTSSRTQPSFFQEAIHKMLVYFGLPLLGLILLSALSLGLWIEKPIRTVSRTMEEVTATGDLSRRVPVRGGGEIATISRAFNQMLEQLSHQRDELMTFRTMILAMKEGVLIENAARDVIYMNPRMEELLGIPFPDPATKPLHLAAKFASKRQVVEDHRGFTTEEVEWVRTDGSRVQALRTSGRLEDPLGKVTGILSTFVDITERNELEIELIQASRMAFLGVYSQGIIHNLNGPLNTILGFSSLLCRNHPEAEIPARIRNDAQRMTDLISALGRRWHRTGEAKTSLLNLNEIIQEELRFLEADLFFKHNVEKEINLDPELPGIYGVYGDFSHALLNVLINAIEALSESAAHRLAVRTSQREGEIRIEIEDSGVGIKLEDLDSIFLPFFSTKSRDRRDGIPKGAGLGLPIARKVLEPYGCIFEVRSEIRQGTCVTLRLPLREGHYFMAETNYSTEGCECPV